MISTSSNTEKISELYHVCSEVSTGKRYLILSRNPKHQFLLQISHFQYDHPKTNTRMKFFIEIIRTIFKIQNSFFFNSSLLCLFHLNHLTSSGNIHIIIVTSPQHGELNLLLTIRIISHNYCAFILNNDAFVKAPHNLYSRLILQLSVYLEINYTQVLVGM